MIRLTFTDERKQVKTLGEAETAEELYACLYAHAKRLFLHPTLVMPGNLQAPHSRFTVGQTKSGCAYEMENIG